MDTFGNNGNKRRIYFIEKKFQAQFILRFCLLVILAGLAAVGLLYWLSGKATTVSIVNSRVVVRSTADFLLPVLLQTVAVVFTLTALATIAVTLFVSHKIAGPLYRFKKVTEGLERGDFSRGFKLRNNDQMQDIAEGLNGMIKANRQRLGVVKELAAIIRNNAEKIGTEDVPAAKQPLLAEIKRVSRELKELSDSFKV
ncbi:MAG: hypothetical protein ACM3OC_02445 [Deltaproteobacteria bacterium]